MGFFWFLLALGFAAVVVAILLNTSTGKEEEETTSILPPKLGKNLGSPLFTDGDEKKLLVSGKLQSGDSVWALTPFGPQFLVVTRVIGNEAHLRNGEFEALAFLDANYFSDSFAKKSGSSSYVWRIRTVLPIQSPIVPANDPRWVAANRHWIEDEFDYEGYFIDPMVFYFFLYSGFNQPWAYYDMYEPPIYEDEVFEEPVVVEEEPLPEPEPEPVVEEEPSIADTGAFETVPSEVTEETFEQIDPEPEPKPEPPVEETPQPAPEPWAYYDMYEPPIYDSGGGSDD